MHRTCNLLISELHILSQIVETKFVLCFLELGYETLQCQTHAIDSLRYVSLGAHAHYFIKEKLLRSKVHLTFWLLWHTDCSSIKLVLFPKRQTTFESVLHVYHFVGWELKFHNKPLKREYSL